MQEKNRTRNLSILGTRGVPANHGGFETFAEHLALFLVGRGWRVTIYCQVDGNSSAGTDVWKGVNRVNIPITQKGAMGTVVFDWKSARLAAQTDDLILTLGYNTAIFCVLYRLKGLCNLINMDGIEWKRGKWSFSERMWLYLNERAGCWLGNHLIADHPAIADHLAMKISASKITTIPYGADRINGSDKALIKTYGLEPNGYALLIARPEPENSILEIVRSFSIKKRRIKLVLLGKYDPDNSTYHRKVMNAASDEILFLGAIYKPNTVKALRFFCRLYIHGHTVGGTNPSLVEAMGAASPVLAHDNRFNRWVAGSGARYFKTTEECSRQLDILLSDRDKLGVMRDSSRKRFEELFTWSKVLSKYEELLTKWSKDVREP